GEDEDDFKELHSFVKDIEFDRLGTFTYSDEDNTHAFSLPDKVSPEIARERQRIIMETQQNISLKKNISMVGKTINTLLDNFDIKTNTFTARSYRDAPEIDNEIIITVKNKSLDVKPGDFVSVRIQDASEYELYGQFIV
ncbi:MAG: 30S ribosomal protein S12 methylthiotransferase RimO, partial [Calditrichaceae bacterium]